MKVTILGCGGSSGIPFADGTPGGNWGDCDPSNPKNRRRRVSILLEQADSIILVDTTPDLRHQLLDAVVGHVDAVLFTHAHADHCHGLDDLRGMTFKKGGPIDAYMDQATQKSLTRRFDYAFTSSCDPENLYRPLFTDHVITNRQRIGDFDVEAFVQEHGDGESLGFRFGPVAYSTDVSALSEDAFNALAGVKLWIVDCLRERPHPTHSHIAQTFEWIARVKPERAILTHMNHNVDYDALKAICPSGVEPGYDGLVIEVSG